MRTGLSVRGRDRPRDARSDAGASRGARAPVVRTHHAAITEPRRVGELLRALHLYVGLPVTEAALKLAPLVFVRPGELRWAEWSEFDLDDSQWRIPGSRMKMGDQHIVPLSRQAVAILRELHMFSGTGQYVFPSLVTRGRPMSENTINAALRRLGLLRQRGRGRQRYGGFEEGGRAGAGRRLHQHRPR